MSPHRYLLSLPLLVLSAGVLGEEYIPNPRFLGPCPIVTNEACSSGHVTFFLYTTAHPEDPELVDAVEGSNNLSSSAFNPDHPTKVIIHGYNSDHTVDSLISIKDAYLFTGDYNVIMADYASLAPAPCYPTAAHNARYVGRCVAELIKNMMIVDDSSQVIPKDLHILGFSLGAQVAAFIGEHLQPLTLPRITGLDPALPLFLTSNVLKKLDPSDADFVDVVHTNAMVQGQLQATGHIDFYMNGGFKQPGCETTESSSGCSHDRAPSYFAESIVSEFGFWGWPCDSWFSYVVGSCARQTPSQIMGDVISKTARGVFYVDTDSTPPYAYGRFYQPRLQ